MTDNTGFIHPVDGIEMPTDSDPQQAVGFLNEPITPKDESLQKDGVSAENGTTVRHRTTKITPLNEAPNDSKRKIVEEEVKDEGDEESDSKLMYGVLETPTPGTSVLLAFQHYITMFVASLSVPFLLSEGICMDEDNLGKAELVGTLFFVCGLVTLLQGFFGVRLPIVQAGTFALLTPTLSFLDLPQYECPLILEDCGNHTLITNETCIELASPEHKDLWKSRLCIIQGSIMTAALLEVVIGWTGAIGFLTRYIGPMSICPTVTLLGVSLFRSAADYGSENWWICIMTLVFLTIFSQYLGGINIPVCSYSKDGGCSRSSYPLFKMFPVILAILISWFVAWVLTITNAIPDDPNHWGYGGRTDVRIESLTEAPWIRIPYPGQWGMPGVDISLICGLFAGLLASIVESVGDYYATARLAGAPPPPTHAINRGIGMEGLGCIIAGAFGTGNGTTSTSINVGVIGLTRCGSRNVVLFSTIFMIGFAIINKFGALFVTMPDPIIGASFFVLFGLIVAVGVSNLQYVDMNSPRNLFIFGFSFFTGLTISEWMKDNPTAIDTGSQTVDSIFYVLLSTAMFIGGLLGFVLDNTIKGTDEERGLNMRHPSQDTASHDTEEQYKIYSLPLGMSWIEKTSWTRHIPFCPTFVPKNEQDIDEDVDSIHKESGHTIENNQETTKI